MAVLYNKFYNPDLSTDNSQRINAEEMADVLFGICDAIEKSRIVQADPESIDIAPDGTVTCLPGRELNYYYAAPEALVYGSALDKNSAWFVLGLLTYFVINGRSFYEAAAVRLVDLPDLISSGGCLIPARHAADTSLDVHSLYEKAMEKLTSWNPQAREEGISFLLNAISRYPSSAEITYVSDGHAVARESKAVEMPSGEIRKGALVTASGGKQYAVSETVKLPFRPGVHRYQIAVEDYQQTQERYLVIRENATGNMTKLMMLDNDPVTRYAEVIRDSDKKYLFYVVAGDPARQQALWKKEVGYLVVPQDFAGSKALLKVAYDPERGCEVALYNREKTKQISDNMIRFQI